MITSEITFKTAFPKQLCAVHLTLIGQYFPNKNYANNAPVGSLTEVFLMEDALLFRRFQANYRMMRLSYCHLASRTNVPGITNRQLE